MESPATVNGVLGVIGIFNMGLMWEVVKFSASLCGESG